MSNPHQLRIFPEQEDPRAEMRDRIEQIFTDNFMFFLTILMLPIIIIPFAVDLSEDYIIFFGICDVIIVSLFIMEYGLKLYFAKVRWIYFKDPWHIFDLFIIILALVGYLPFYESDISGSSVLFLRVFRLFRYLRFSRVLAVTGRSIGKFVRPDKKKTEDTQDARGIEIKIVNEHQRADVSHCDWENLEHIMDEKNPQWIDISNITEKNFAQLSNILHIPEVYFKSKFLQESYPQIDYLEKASLVFLQSGKIQYPVKGGQNYLTIEKHGFLIICNDHQIFSLTQNKVDFFSFIHQNIQKSKNDITPSLILEVLYGLLHYTIQKYRDLIGDLEIDLMDIENIPHTQIPSDFLEQTFQIKKELSNLSSNLAHLKEILADIVGKKVPLVGFNDVWKDYFSLLEAEASYLHESAENCKENLLSIIDLFLNRNSYETNKIMRVLAIVTTIAVVPAAVSGILGENLLDAPYGLMLWQILLLISFGMGLILYIFFKLGWLKN